jgi:hypothetical protein
MPYISGAMSESRQITQLNSTKLATCSMTAPNIIFLEKHTHTQITDEDVVGRLSCASQYESSGKGILFLSISTIHHELPASAYSSYRCEMRCTSISIDLYSTGFFAKTVSKGNHHSRSHTGDSKFRNPYVRRQSIPLYVRRTHCAI